MVCINVKNCLKILGSSGILLSKFLRDQLCLKKKKNCISQEYRVIWPETIQVYQQPVSLSKVNYHLVNEKNIFR